MIVYGVISYVLIIALTAGYFVVKKYGDKVAALKPAEEGYN